MPAQHWSAPVCAEPRQLEACWVLSRTRDDLWVAEQLVEEEAFQGGWMVGESGWWSGSGHEGAGPAELCFPGSRTLCQIFQSDRVSWILCHKVGRAELNSPTAVLEPKRCWPFWCSSSSGLQEAQDWNVRYSCASYSLQSLALYDLSNKLHHKISL